MSDSRQSAQDWWTGVRHLASQAYYTFLPVIPSNLIPKFDSTFLPNVDDMWLIYTPKFRQSHHWIYLMTEHGSRELQKKH